VYIHTVDIRQNSGHTSRHVVKSEEVLGIVDYHIIIYLNPKFAAPIAPRFSLGLVAVQSLVTAQATLRAVTE
jgi:hypothetical protein